MSKNALISVKVDKGALRLIDLAAKSTYHSRSSFVREAAIQRAEQIVLEQDHISVEGRRFQRFFQALDTPLANNSRLKRLLTRGHPGNQVVCESVTG